MFTKPFMFDTKRKKEQLKKERNKFDQHVRFWEKKEARKEMYPKAFNFDTKKEDRKKFNQHVRFWKRKKKKRKKYGKKRNKLSLKTKK